MGKKSEKYEKGSSISDENASTFKKISMNLSYKLQVKLLSNYNQGLSDQGSQHLLFFVVLINYVRGLVIRSACLNIM